MKDTTSSSSNHQITGSRAPGTATVAIIAGALATAVAGALVATGHSDLVVTRILGLVGMCSGVITAGCAVTTRGVNRKAAYATAGVLLLIASSTVYGITWS